MDPSGFELASHRPRRKRWLPVVVVLAAVAIGGTAIAFGGLSPHKQAGATHPCTGAVTVTIAAAQVDVPTFTALARRWNATTPATGSRPRRNRCRPSR